MGKITKTTKPGTPKKRGEDQLGVALRVSDRIQLDSVRLMHCECTQSRLVGPSEKNFEIDRESSSSMDLATNRVFVWASFTLRTFEKRDSSSEPYVIIKATFLLMYRAVSLDDITEETVELFAKTNGIFNAWPYWREFVQNTTSRMNLPPLTIPVFRLFPQQEIAPSRRKAVPSKKVSAKKTVAK